MTFALSAFYKYSYVLTYLLTYNACMVPINRPMCAKNHRNRYRHLATIHQKPYGPYPHFFAILRHISEDICALFLWMYVDGYSWLVGHARYCGQMAEVSLLLTN